MSFFVKVAATQEVVVNYVLIKSSILLNNLRKKVHRVGFFFRFRIVKFMLRSGNTFE